jgi:adenylate cyclase
MAAFGVPLARTTEAEIQEDATHAIECALAMERMVIDLNRRWDARQLPKVGMRVGIYTGPLVVGSIGNSKRLEYSIHGDMVNTASRLESFDKDNFMPDFFNRPIRILIGDATLGYLNHRFKVQRYGEFQLRGKEQKVDIHRVLGRNG